MECGGVFDVCYHEIPPLGCYTQRLRDPKQISIRRRSILSGIVDAEPLLVKTRNRYIVSKMKYSSAAAIEIQYSFTHTSFELKKRRLGSFFAQESAKGQDTSVPRV